MLYKVPPLGQLVFTNPSGKIFRSKVSVTFSIFFITFAIFTEIIKITSALSSPVDRFTNEFFWNFKKC